ncbi:hypothetical protein [Streptomyces lavendofoliae]|uniref:hypothetical protein n=1 Tax=Streptomyces lavendofoliae TaxID=67314 RepID=UPI001677FDCD|nr:hypothetical protein [Streptomyces lavendofoliae]
MSGILEAAEGKKIRAVSAGNGFSLALTEDGTLLAAGNDSSQQVSGILEAAKGKKIRAVSAGNSSALAVTEDGTLLTAGEGVEPLARAAAGQKVTVASGGSGFGLAVTEDGTLLAAGNDSSQQVSGILEAAKGKKIRAVSAGLGESAALTEDGTLLISRAWHGLAELAQAVSDKRVVDVCAYGPRALAVTDGGTLLAFGAQEHQETEGILRAAEGKKIMAVGAGWYLSLAVTEDGTLLAAGNDRFQQVSGILEATAGKKVTAVSGEEHVLAIVQEADQDCGPLKPRQICASLHASGDPQDAYALVLKVADEQQVLTSGGPCKAVDTQSAQATHVIVRRAVTSQDIASGSAYFTYDQTTGVVGIDTAKSQLPDQLTYQRSDSNRFTFTWTP